MKPNPPPVLGVLLALAASHAFAMNAVQNPDFNTDLAGWTTTTVGAAGAYRDSGFGSPTGGTLRLDAFDNGETASAQQCVDIHKFAWIDFRYRYEIVLAYGAGYHQAVLSFYGQPGCDGPELGEPVYADEADAVAVENNYREAGAYVQVPPAGTLSARVDFAAIGGSQQVSGGYGVMIDHVNVGPLDVIFADDNEL